MPAIAIVGAQWGDEGKGKVIDMLAGEAHMVVRFSGGNNAGHTVVNSLGEFKLHLIPSGIFHSDVTCVIGNGVVVDPQALWDEAELLEKCGISISNLRVSERAHLIMPYHRLLDGLEETAKGKEAIGTTLRGVGPAFVDKTARLGIRAGDLFDKEALRERLQFVLAHKNSILTKVYNVEPVPFEALYKACLEYAERLRPYICATEALLWEAAESGQKIILEGAQGTLLDLDFGTYPYVTSSHPIVAGACLGSGLSPRHITEAMGIFKAYTTRVGSGPMPTELLDETGTLIRERAHEFGATTGRPRRCGWFDAVAARYSARVNGLTCGALTRLDVLDIFPSLKICVGYRMADVNVDTMPPTVSQLQRCEPVYEELPGWQEPITGVRRFEDLPRAARAYVQRLEELVGCPFHIISVGPGREETIVVKPPL